MRTIKYLLFVVLTSILYNSCTKGEDKKFTPCSSEIIPNAFDFIWEDTIANGKFSVCSPPVIYNNSVIYLSDTDSNKFQFIKRDIVTNKVLLTCDIDVKGFAQAGGTIFYIKDNSIESINLDNFQKGIFYIGNKIDHYHHYGNDKIQILNNKLYVDDYFQSAIDSLYEMRLLEIDIFTKQISTVYSTLISNKADIPPLSSPETRIRSFKVWKNNSNDLIFTYLKSKKNEGLDYTYSIVTHNLTTDDSLYSYYCYNSFYGITSFDIFDGELVLREENNNNESTYFTCFNGTTQDSNWIKKAQIRNLNRKFFFRKSNHSIFIQEYESISEFDLLTGDKIGSYLQKPYDSFYGQMIFYNDSAFFFPEDDKFVTLDLNSGCLNRIINLNKMSGDEKFINYFTFDQNTSMLYLYSNYRILAYKIIE